MEYNINSADLERTLEAEAFRVIRHEVVHTMDCLGHRELSDENLGAFVRGVASLQREMYQIISTGGLVRPEVSND